MPGAIPRCSIPSGARCGRGCLPQRGTLSTAARRAPVGGAAADSLPEPPSADEAERAVEAWYGSCGWFWMKWGDPVRCDHEHDDGAYVLGALSPSERAAYERHLATCSFCREAVADIAVLPGLLGRLDAADLAAMLEPDLPRRRDRMPELVVAAKTSRARDRRRSRWRTAGFAVAAACLALVFGLGGMFLWLDRPGPTGAGDPAPTVAMQAVDSTVPVTANVSLTSTKWGTKVTMTCLYAGSDGSGKANTFRLMAYGPDDASDQLGSWTAAPGSAVDMAGITRFNGETLNRLILQRHDGKALLTYDVP